MAANQAPQAHQVRIRELATGRVFDAWPVDAREMLNHVKGGFEAVGPEIPLGIPVAGQTSAPDPAPAPSIAAQLEAKSYKDLQLLAKRAGVASNQSREDLVTALVPLVEAKAVSLEELPKLALDPVQFPHAAPAE